MTIASTNPRFTNYCIASGLTLAQGARELWRFNLWIKEMWEHWRKERGIKDRWYHANDQQQAEFDEWLTRKIFTA